MEDVRFAKQGEADRGYDPLDKSVDFMTAKSTWNKDGTLFETAITISLDAGSLKKYDQDPEQFFAEIANSISHESLHCVMARLAMNAQEHMDFYQFASEALDNQEIFGNTKSYLHSCGFNEVGLIQCMKKYEKKKRNRSGFVSSS